MKRGGLQRAWLCPWGMDFMGKACLPRTSQCCQTQFGRTKCARTIRAGWSGGPRGNTHTPVIRSPLGGKRRCLQPFLWAGGRVRGTRRQEAPGSPAWSAGWAHLSPALGSRGPASLSSLPPPPRSTGTTCRAVGMADPCVGHISAPPRLAGEAFPGHPDHRAPSLAAPSLASLCPSPRRQGLAPPLSCSQHPG